MLGSDSRRHMCVRMQLCMCPLYMCPHTAVYVSHTLLRMLLAHAAIEHPHTFLRMLQRMHTLLRMLQRMLLSPLQ